MNFSLSRFCFRFVLFILERHFLSTLTFRWQKESVIGAEHHEKSFHRIYALPMFPSATRKKRDEIEARAGRRPAKEEAKGGKEE